MTVILDQFLQTLRESGLMAAQEIDSFLGDLPPEESPTTSEQLAKLLVKRQKLTKFQAQAVYQGKTRGLRVGNYLVLDKLGQGGMGYVYKAQHRKMQRVVALKVLPSGVAKDTEAVQRFQREVVAAAQLSHPNIVTAHDADEADGVHFLVMEFVEGKDLGAVVRDRGPLPVAKAVDYIVQAAKGLEYAHSKRVVHRDIKPANLLLDSAGTVKVLDMGLARFEQRAGGYESTAAAALTQTGQVMGTIDYMPPEQALDTHMADERSDQYSLGCTLFYLLTGRALYVGDSLAKKILAHREEPIPSLCAIRRDVHQELDAVFQKMVAKQAKDRFRSMGEAIVALEACRNLKTQPVSQTVPPLPHSAERTPVEAPVGRPFQAGHDGPEGPSYAAADTDKQQAAAATRGSDSGTGSLGFEDWLNAELPAIPTLLRPLPRRKSRVKPEHIFYGAVAVGAVLLLVLLGIVLKVRTKDGTLVVQVNQPDAEVSVDGNKVTIKISGDNQPVEIQVAEGRHTLLVKKGGFETFTKEFTIRSGGKETIRVELLGKKPEIAAEPAKPAEPGAPEPTAATPASAPAASGATSVSPVDPHRRVAEAVLKLGGTVTVVGASRGHVSVAALKDLPAEPFALYAVDLNGRGNVGDVDLKDLEGVGYLSQLNLVGSSITDAALKHLAGTETMALAICDTAIGDGTAGRLSGRQDLLSLDMGNSGASLLRITDAACAHLKQLPRLRYLNLAGTEVGEQGLAELAGLRSLERLNIGRNSNAKGLAPLGALPNLQCLALMKNSIGEDLIEVLPKFPQLRFLDLWYAECPDVLGLRLQKALPNATVHHPAVAPSERERKSLRWLLENKATVRGAFGGQSGTFQEIPEGTFCVSDVTMAENGPSFGAANVRGLRNIESLGWRNLKTADAEAEHIATLTTLKLLTLGGSDLAEAGLQRLANLKQLEQLRLDRCQDITDRGLEHLTRLEHLWLLDVDMTPISDRGLEHVGRINGLQVLGLTVCPKVTSEGLRHVTRLPILRLLNLDATAIDDGAVKHLKQMSCLRILHLRQTKVTASGIEELRRGLPKCVIFWDGGAVIPGASAPGSAAPADPADAASANAPPLAVAPFDAAAARKHQEAWAKHLGVPVETTNSIGMRLVLIPPGELNGRWLGSRVENAFYLGVHEVTQGQYRRVVGANPSYFSSLGDSAPVESVSKNESQEFCTRLTAMEKEPILRGRYRLPTENEWVYACHAGAQTEFFFGDDPAKLDDYAWFSENSGDITHPVGQKKPNPWGLFDVYGNVAEQCQGDVNYGAAWAHPRASVANRFGGILPDAKEKLDGFRVVVEIDPGRADRKQ